MLARKRSLLIKVLLLVPVTWFAVSTFIAYSEKIRIEKTLVETDDNKEIEVNRPDVGGRHPHQSVEETRIQVRQMHDQDAAVIPPPKDPDGPGEMGKPVKMTNLSSEQEKMMKDGWERNAFNQYVSDLISLHRSLPDVRGRGCQEEKYSENLPPTSVIICFHNEAWSVLLRTVHSVLDRSPPHLIKEIILVDDFSDLPHLGRQLDDYLVHIPKVRVVRARRREGLIRARLLGASVAQAQILTYLDSHCECTTGWLEPLLQRISDNWTTSVCPVIDVINDDTFEYHYKDNNEGIHVGGFDWNLQFNWHAIPEREKNRRRYPWDPVRSPTMAGGLFAIDKRFFERLGTYDSGFDIWGGENLELSFKIWMCGGTLEIVPCSHVGHIFRKRSPYKWRSGINVLKRNSVRLAEVWLDEYKQYYYKRIGNDLGDFGDVQSRKEIRKKLQCKSFDWYLKNIYPEQFIPGEALASGEVRNHGFGGDTCLDSPARKDDLHKPVGLYPCHGQGGNQYWMLTKGGEIRRDEACLDYAGQDVTLYPCHGSKGNQLWYYDPNTHMVQHGSSGKCLEISLSKQQLLMAECTGEDKQKWTFENYDPSKALQAAARS